MNILVAIDSFKGTLSSTDLGSHLKAELSGLNVQVEPISVSDGGEGLLEALTTPLSLTTTNLMVTGPLGQKITSKVGYSATKSILVAELALASGLPLVPEQQRNPLHTTTYGCGEILNLAKEKKCQHLLFGVGGSATSDGGLGALQALGLTFSNIPIPATGKDLIHIQQIRGHENHWLHNLDFQIACDVNNPFTGPQGSAKTYGPQKCYSSLNIPPIIDQIEQGMKHLKQLIIQNTGIDLDKVPGAGAAGGIAGSMHALLKAKLNPGIQIIFEAIHLNEAIQKSDLVITGEGRLDHQTMNGKVVSGILQEAHKWKKPVWGLCGQNSLSKQEINTIGLQKVFTLLDYAPLKDCLEKTEDVVKLAAAHIKQELGNSFLDKN